MTVALAHSSGLALMTMVLLAAKSSLHQASAFPRPGSAAQELEKLLFEKVARATEEESKVVNGKIDKMKDYPTSASSNKGSNDIDFDEVLRQKSSAEIDDIKGHSEDKDKDSEPVILLETLPGASKQFQDTFSFLKAAYSSTTESPHAPNQLKKPRVSSLTLPSGTIHKGSPQNCWFFSGGCNQVPKPITIELIFRDFCVVPFFGYFGREI